MENHSKFKPVLQERVDRDKENAKKDAELRKEFGIKDGRTVGIKTYKESAITSIWKILCKIVTFIATIILFVLAFIGVAALIHPDARTVMLDIWVETISQLEAFLPFL